MSLLRVYEASECGKDGYPLAWHRGEPSIKDLVRNLTGHRCVRCLHPYAKGTHGKGEWSPCDEKCNHVGPCRVVAENHSDEVVGWGPIDCTPEFVKAGKVQARWRILTVHHLTGVKADCRWWNLAALCQRCHLQIQGRVRMEQIYPYPHSGWFKPHAAGYYAATYLGEDLTREQTVDRLDELLALELQPPNQPKAAMAAQERSTR